MCRHMSGLQKYKADAFLHRLTIWLPDLDSNQGQFD